MFIYSLDGKTLYYTSIDLAISGFSFDQIYATIWLARSTDGGKTFTRSKTSKLASGTVNSTTGQSIGVMVDKEWMTIDRSNSSRRGTVYGSFLAINLTDTIETLNVASLAPGMTSFTTTAAAIPTQDLVMMQIATIDVDYSGNVHMTFMGTPDYEVYYIYHSVSTDGAKTFSKPNIVSRIELAHRSLTSYDSFIPGIDTGRQYPSIQVACGKPGTAREKDLYCIWEALGISSPGSTGEDIYFARSSDNGASWSMPIVINKDHQGLNRHQFRPSTFISSNGMIAAGWYDGREEEDNTSVDYYISYSLDGGRSFTGETKVSSLPTDFSTIGLSNGNFGVGEYLQVLASDNYILPIWSDGRNDDGTIGIYSAKVPLESSSVNSMSGKPESLHITSNPVKEKTTITVSAREGSAIDISIFDALGRKMETLFHGIMNGTENTLIFSPEKISSGIYYLTLTSEGHSITKPISYIK